MAFKGMHPQDALHIVKQESHRYAYGNGRADTQAKHQNTNFTLSECLFLFDSEKWTMDLGSWA